MKNQLVPPSNQRGMALVLSLIFLAIVTLVSLSSMQGSVLQGRMAAHQQDYNAALQSAEASLHEAEVELQISSAGDRSGTDCYLTKTPPTKAVLDKSGSWTYHPAGQSHETLNSYYCIELVTKLGSRSTPEAEEMLELLYRIVSVGFGRSEETSVTLEMFFVSLERAGS